MSKRVAIAVILLAMLPQYALAAEITYRWTEPTEGTPVVHYTIQVELAGGEWIPIPAQPTEPTITINQDANVAYRLRVAGVDAAGHQGPWSTPSVSYTYGAPGACGQPQREE